MQEYEVTAAVLVKMSKEQCPSCNGALTPSGRGLIEAAGFGIIPGIDTSKGDVGMNGDGSGANPRYMMGEPIAPFKPRYGVQCADWDHCKFIGSIEISVEEADELRGRPLNAYDDRVMSDG